MFNCFDKLKTLTQTSYHKKIESPDQGPDCLPIQIKGKIKYRGIRISAR